MDRRRGRDELQLLSGTALEGESMGSEMSEAIGMSESGEVRPSVGARFARALAAKDAAALRGCLAGALDFQALTPGRHWHAVTPEEVVDAIVLGRWFGPEDDIRELRSVTEGRVAGRRRVAYLVLVHSGGKDHLVEQQAYYDAEDGLITWMRVLCSGYQEIGAEELEAAALV
jgi:hypothetical protein